MQYFYAIYIFLFLFLYVPASKDYNIYISFIPLLLISTIGFIYVLAKYEKKFRLEYNNKPQYKYWRETEFKNIEPIYAGYLLGIENVNINGVIATIFLLELKKVLNIEIINNRYIISINKNLTSEEFNSLKKYEQEILKLLFESVKDKSKIDLQEQLIKFNNNYEYKVALNNMYWEIEADVENKFFKCFSPEKNPISINLFGIHLGNVFFGWLVIMFNIINVINLVTIINVVLYLIGLAIFIFAITKKFIKEEYYDEINCLYGLCSFLADQESLKEKELKEAKLYDKFMLYAIGLGIADNVEKQFNQEKLENNLYLNLQLLTSDFYQNKNKFLFEEKKAKEKILDKIPITISSFVFFTLGLILILSNIFNFSPINLFLGICLIIPFSICMFIMVDLKITYNKMIASKKVKKEILEKDFMK